MPYIFPYESLFIWGMSLLIIILLGVRFVVARRQRFWNQERTSRNDE